MYPHSNLKNFEYKFTDLIDITEFNTFLDSFYKVTGIPNGLLSSDGEILSKSGWTDACEFFHRINPTTNNNCLLNDRNWIYSLKEKEIICSSCKNGLLTYAIPITIQQQPIAVLFLGQISDKPLDMDFFKKQGLKYDFEEESYLKAMEQIPVVSKDKMESLMESIVNMAQVLANHSLSRFEKIIIEKDLEKINIEKVELSDILRLTPNGIGWSNLNGDIEYVNEQFTKLFGYTKEDIPAIEIFKNIINSSYSNMEINIKCKDETYKHTIVKSSLTAQKMLVSFNDITEHWKIEQRNKGNQKILEMIARAEPLSEILYEIIKIIESEDLESICSILLLDKNERYLLNSIHNRLPKFYNDEINGIEIGMGVGSCGTAAFLRRRYIAEDIMNDSNWIKYKDIAKKADLASCWSEPIVSSEGKVLGIFTIYHSKVSKPNDSDLERMVFAANIASIAIENKNNREKLEILAYTDYLTGLRNRRSFIEQAETELYRSIRYSRKFSLIMFDIDYFKSINDTFGHNVGDIVLQKIANICQVILREIDIVGRIGGEEFAILLPETDIKKATQVAQRLCDTISESEVLILDKRFNFTASFGVVFADKLSILTIDELLNQADNALYQAKKSGRNKVCVAK